MKSSQEVLVGWTEMEPAAGQRCHGCSQSDNVFPGNGITPPVINPQTGQFPPDGCQSSRISAAVGVRLFSVFLNRSMDVALYTV